MDDAVKSQWITFECGAFYMKALYLAKTDIERDNLMDNYVVYDIKGSTSGVSSPIKKLQVVAITSQSSVKEYFGRLADFSGDCGYETRFDGNWELFEINRLQFYEKGTAYKRKPYVDGTSKIPVNPPVSVHATPTSIDDIDFNKIAFCYTKPDNKDFFGREDFVKKLHDCFEDGKNCLNVVATGGMGKTSIAHIYIEKYRREYDQVHFVTSNHNICDDFNEDLRKCITNIVPSYGALLKPRQEGDKNDFLGQVDHILAKATKKCLLVVDVNVDEEGLSALKLNEAKTKWHILYLSRKKIMGTLNKGFELPNFEDDLDGAKGLFNSIYPNDWEDDKLKDLFKLVYYHPLLIEHLAAYGIRGQNRKTYQQLCDVVSENRIKNATINKSYSEFSTCFIDKEKTKDVCVYLSQLFDINDYDKNEQYIMQHFILWPYDYISIDTVNLLLKTDEINDWEDTLIGLTDKVVFSQSSMGYRMHGLLVDTLKSEKLDFDYTNYIANVKSRLSLGDEIDRDIDTYNCIVNTPLEIFGIGSTKDYSVYEDWNFLRGLAKLKRYDVRLSELSYKAYLFKEFYNNSGEEIYRRVYGEYKNVSSHLIYDEWLYTKSNYNNDLPNEESDDYGKFIIIPVNGVSFKMRKVKHGSFPMGSNDYSFEPVHQVTLTNDYYIGEVQVTQQLWMAVMGENNNPSFFNEGKKTKNHPVECVSWYDCMDFIMRLNELMKYKNYQFRLPTEAEWEYAARSRGKTHTFSWTDDSENLYIDSAQNERGILEKFAYCCGHKDGTQAVRLLNPNSLGLYGMSGNVWEWCQDWAADYFSKSVINPQVPRSGGIRVLRGGSYNESANYCRVSSLYYGTPDLRDNGIGFRLLLSSQKNDEE